MAKKLKKYPKKPKRTASSEVLKNYLLRCKQVDKDNTAIKKEKSDKEKLLKQVSSIGRAK